MPPFDDFFEKGGLLLILSQYLGPSSTSDFCNIALELNLLSLIKKEKFLNPIGKLVVSQKIKSQFVLPLITLPTWRVQKFTLDCPYLWFFFAASDF